MGSQQLQKRNRTNSEKRNQFFSSQAGQSLAPPPLQLHAKGANVLQRACGVDQSCADDMTYASSWDGTKSETKPTGGISAGGNMSIGGSYSKTTTVGIDNETAFSQSSGYEGGMSYDPNSGKVGANAGYSQTTQIGDQTDTRGVSGSGYLDFNEKGQLEGAGGSLGASANGTSVNIGGGILVSAKAPIMDAQGKYIVSWQRKYTGNIGGGHTGKKGVGVSGSYEGEYSVVGSKSFGSKAEADAFYKGGSWKNIDPNDARSLGKGDTVSSTSSNKLSGGVSGSIMGVSVGGSLTVGGKHELEVTGLGNDKISVRVVDSNILGGSASIGAPGITLSGGKEYTKSKGYILTFDLSSKEGQASFSFLRQMGYLPGNGRGYTLEADIKGSQEQTSTGVSLAGANINHASTTSETTTKYKDGRTVETRTGEGASGISVFGAFFRESDKLTATEDSQSTERSYSVTSKASSSSTQDVNKELAQSTGVTMDTVRNDHANQKARKWTITSTFSQKQIDRLIQEIKRGNWNYQALINQSGYGKDFGNEVRAAGSDWDRIDRALTAFISNTDDDGLKLIRNTIGARPQYSLTLQGNPYMTGEAGHSALNHKIAKWEKKLNAKQSPQQIGSNIIHELKNQQQRLTAISDPERYPDLPSKLRHAEVKRTQGEIAKLASLRDRAIQMAQTSAQKHGLKKQTAGKDKDSDLQKAPSLQQEWQEVDVYSKRVIEECNQCVKVANQARLAHYIHVKGPYSFHSAYRTWGERHWYGDDIHVAEYERGQLFMNAGNSLWGKAENAWNTYLEQKAKLQLMPPAQAHGKVKTNLTAALSHAINTYNRAKHCFKMAFDLYESIRAKHPDRKNDQWAGYSRGIAIPEHLELYYKKVEE